VNVCYHRVFIEIVHRDFDKSINKKLGIETILIQTKA